MICNIHVYNELQAMWIHVALQLVYYVFRYKNM